MINFFYTLLPFAGIVLSVFILLFKVLVENSLPIFVREGLEFITSNIWRPSETDYRIEYYGILSPIIGTLYTSLIALVIALPASIALTVFVNEYVPHRFKTLIVNLIEVMAGLPTVLLWFVGSLYTCTITKRLRYGAPE